MKRLVLMTSVIAIAAAPALGGDSVLTFDHLNTDADSVTTFSCSTCPPLKEKDTGPNVHGIEVSETIIGGQKKVVQTYRKGDCGGLKFGRVKSIILPLMESELWW